LSGPLVPVLTAAQAVPATATLKIATTAASRVTFLSILVAPSFGRRETPTALWTLRNCYHIKTTYHATPLSQTLRIRVEPSAPCWVVSGSDVHSGKSAYPDPLPSLSHPSAHMLVRSLLPAHHANCVFLVSARILSPREISRIHVDSLARPKVRGAGQLTTRPTATKIDCSA